jgi:hypothetical protein
MATASDGEAGTVSTDSSGHAGFSVYADANGGAQMITVQVGAAECFTTA